MLQRDRYREVSEMDYHRPGRGFSAGQERQEKTECVSDVRGLKNFLKFGALNTPKGTKGMRFQEFLNSVFRKSFQNFVPFVPERWFGAYRAYRIVIFPCGGGIVKVTKLRALNTPLIPGVI